MRFYSHSSQSSTHNQETEDMRRLISSPHPDDHIPTSLCNFSLPNVPCTQTGWTMLHVFAWEGKTEAVEMLCRNAADVNAVDCTLCSDVQNTALHIAAWAGNVEVIKVLLEFKANTNIKNAVRDSQEGSKAVDLAPKELKDCIEELMQKSSAFVDDERNSSTAQLLNLPYGRTDQVVKVKGTKVLAAKVAPLHEA